MLRFRLTLPLALAAGLAMSLAHAQNPYHTKHVIIAVMDGARWQDTFGDPEHANIPHLWHDIRPHGCLFTHYYNRGITVTHQGHSTMASGTWQVVPNAGPRLTMPTFFEYLRDEKGIPPTKAWSVFGKGAYSFAPYSSHPGYGEKFACSHICGGGPDKTVNEASHQGDVGVLNKVVALMKQYEPELIFINFGWTDHSGHIATDFAQHQAGIQGCDEVMFQLWKAVEADPNYKDTTTILFTNDHGRHTADFHSHGDRCDGCEHIMLLAVGPDVKHETTLDSEALQIDIAPTVGELLGFQTPLATGRVLTECLTDYRGINKQQAVTAAAREAVAAEKLANRDLVRLAADWTLANMKPTAVAAGFQAEILMQGLMQAAATTKDKRYTDFVEQWLEAHRNETGPGQVSVGNVILDLQKGPQGRRPFMPTAQRIARDIAGQSVKPGALTRDVALPAAAFLARFGAATKHPGDLEAALLLAKIGLAQPAPPLSDTVATAQDLTALAVLAGCYADALPITKPFAASLFRCVQGMKEQGELWADPLASVLNLSAILAAQRNGALEPYIKTKGGARLPLTLDAMTPKQAAALFPGAKVRAPRRQISNMIFTRARLSLEFSRDMLRYALDDAGKCADGSPAAQGGFLLAYQKLPWNYGGNKWPGTGKVSVGTVDMGPKP